MSRRFADEDPDDYIDRREADRVQRISDAYADGKQVGRMGLGAGLCPHGYSNDERDAWLRGFTDGASTLVTNRRAA